MIAMFLISIVVVNARPVYNAKRCSTGVSNDCDISYLHENKNPRGANSLYHTYINDESPSRFEGTCPGSLRDSSRGVAVTPTASVYFCNRVKGSPVFLYPRTISDTARTLIDGLTLSRAVEEVKGGSQVYTDHLGAVGSGDVLEVAEKGGRVLAPGVRVGVLQSEGAE